MAFRRAGTAEAPGCVVVLTNGGESGKTVALGADLAHTARRDFLGNRQEEITTDDGQRPFPGQRRQRQRLGAGRQPVSARRRVMMTRRQN